HSKQGGKRRATKLLDGNWGFGYSSIVITEEVAKSTNPITFNTAENCLNFQRALLEKLMTWAILIICVGLPREHLSILVIGN
ncbi:MAG: hypothetical protein KAV87_45115, partial [Desulfobacteraceae bacterium]|nr:hypothetical protein [Desulfobacteraceae bacterium]